jgi:hypothetical protein
MLVLNILKIARKDNGIIFNDKPAQENSDELALGFFKFASIYAGVLIAFR